MIEATYDVEAWEEGNLRISLYRVARCVPCDISVGVGRDVVISWTRRVSIVWCVNNACRGCRSFSLFAKLLLSERPRDSSHVSDSRACDGVLCALPVVIEGRTRIIVSHIIELVSSEYNLLTCRAFPVATPTFLDSHITILLCSDRF